MSVSDQDIPAQRGLPLKSNYFAVFIHSRHFCEGKWLCQNRQEKEQGMILAKDILKVVR